MQLLPLVMAMAWLLNPLVHNINLFEFHFLPFALVPLFFMLLAYERGQRKRFVLFAVLALLVREDVSLVVAAVSVLALFERKSWWWRTVPLLMGVVWFIAATRTIAYFAPGDSYKFLIYYSWLGDSFGSMAMNAVLHPLKLAAHVFQPRNFEMLIGFGLPLIMLPYLAPRRLVLAAGPLLQIVLGAAGGGALILETHYATLFLPGLFLATMAALRRCGGAEKSLPAVLPSRLPALKIALALMAFSSVYGALILGPLPYAAAKMISGDGRAEARDAATIVTAVPKGVAVAASYRLLPQLSSREQVFSAHYVFLGVEQFATRPYGLPDGLPVLLAFDSRDLATYRAQFLATDWARPHYEGGRERLAAIAGPVRSYAGPFTLYGPPSSSFAAEPLFDAPPSLLSAPLNFMDGTRILGWQAKTENGRLKLQLEATLGETPNESKRLTFTLDDGRGHAFQFERPLVNELRQDIASGARYEFETDLQSPQLPAGTYSLTVALDSRDETHILDGIRSTTRMVLRKTEFGQHRLGAIEIGE